MPTQASNLTALRAGGSFSLVYLSVYVGTEVLNATLTAPTTYPTKNWTITVNTGSAANVKAGYRVDVYSSGGSFKGRTRIRYAGTISSVNLPVREMNLGYIDLDTGDIVKVIADVRLSDKLVGATVDFKPDDLSFSDQGANPPPLPTSGGAWAGWDTMLPIPLTGSNSALVDPDSVTTPTHLYTFPAGLTGSSTTAADPNITAATAAEYLVTHAVTDPDNSKTITTYVPIIVHNASNPPYNVLLEDCSGEEVNGYVARVQWMGDTATLTAVPDGAFCILWKEEYINGARQSFGQKSPGRSHILMTGYIRREQGSFDGQSGVESLSFEIISPLARLNELIGYSKVMTQDTTPDDWTEVKTLKVKRAIIQLWQFYTNASEAGFDLVFDSNFSDATYPQFFIQKSTPLGQLREIADGRKARLICDRSGRFSVHTKPELYAIGSRSGATQTINLTTADILNWQYSREHWRPVEMLEARGFTASSSPLPIFSRWPGTAPGQGTGNSVVERLIEDTQAALNISAGQLGAAADGIYVDANGVLQEALDLELRLPPGYHVADFYDEYVAITLTTAMRGLDLSTQLFVLRSVALDIDQNGALFVRWTLRSATNGAAGQTYVPPAEIDNGIGGITLPPLYWDFPPFLITDLYTLPKGTIRMGLILTTGIALTTDFDTSPAAGGPTWVFYDWASLGLASFIMDGVSDPYSARYAPGATSGAVDLLVANAEGIFRIADVGTTRTVTTLHTFATAMPVPGYRIIEMLYDQNYIQVVSYYPSGVAAGTRAISSTDGATFGSEGAITTNVGSGVSTKSFIPGLAMARIDAKCYTSAMTTTGTNDPTFDGYVSVNSGSSFSAMSSPDVQGIGEAGSIHIPQHNNAAESIMFYGYYDGVVFESRLYRANGVSRVDVSPTVSLVKFGPQLNRGIDSCPADGSRVVLCGRSRNISVGGSDPAGVFVSRNGGATTAGWTQITTDTGDTAYYVVRWNGNDPNAFLLGGVAKVGQVTDYATVIDRTGNLAILTPTGRVENFFGY